MKPSLLPGPNHASGPPLSERGGRAAAPRGTFLKTRGRMSQVTDARARLAGPPFCSAAPLEAVIAMSRHLTSSLVPVFLLAVSLPGCTSPKAPEPAPAPGAAKAPAPAVPAAVPTALEGAAAAPPAAPAPIPGFVEKGIDWIVSAQHPNGGWGAGSHAHQDVRDPK